VLQDIVARMCRRDSSRPEAEVQADVRQFILAAPFELDEDDVTDIVSLEAQVGGGRRIDVEVGSTVIEVKRDLRRGRVREEAIEQLAGYVASRGRETGRRYVGVLTDGAEWICYNLVGEDLHQVSKLEIKGDADSAPRLVFWLEGVLATATGITPNAREIEARLGASSSAYALDRATVAALYERNRELPTIKVKRELWSRLLTSALGSQFDDDDALFIEHTLLVNTAEIIAHAVLGLPVAELNPASLLSGDKFAEAGVHGVVEADFFDWVLEVETGGQFIKTLARRLMRFDWTAVREDVLKVLYESVIGAETRKELGEYYTPDWLAQAIVEEVVTEPLTTRLLDPSCGSGTFLFHCVRQYLGAAEAQEQPLEEVLRGVTSHVIGMDLHPVAVTFARVTYLLAIGRSRLTDPARQDIHIPVFLGDSLQWREQHRSIFSTDALVIHVDDGRALFGDELRFPNGLLADARLFDDLVEELARRAATSQPGRAAPSLAPVFSRLAIPSRDQPTIEATFATMCRLHNEGRDHIWGYYIRNMARPMWLTQEANRVDVLIGNPPWLAYRHMPEEMQATFKALSEGRNLWAGKEVATHQDLSALFVVRAMELYLRMGGKVAMVLPNAAVDRGQYAGFRAGNYSEPIGNVSLAFEGSWDLRRIRPHFFPRGSSVIFARRSHDPVALTERTLIWTGKLRQANSSWAVAQSELTREGGVLRRTTGVAKSPFAPRFSQGATFNPRFLFVVAERAANALGLSAGRMSVASHRSVSEKAPYKDLPSIEGVVESEFVRPVYSGESLLPYRVVEPLLAVIPCAADHLLTPREIDLHTGLRQWWNQAEAAWEANRSSERLSLVEQLDYQSKLTKQLPVPPFRVIYNASGMHLAAAKVRNPRAIVSKSLYWAAFRDEDEADYLCAILNSACTTECLRPFMSYGKDERHVDKHLWELPIPAFDAEDPQHRELVTLGRQLSEMADTFPVDPALHFAATRRNIRQMIEGSPAGLRIAEIVYEMLS
jgi:hypothetical protein